MFCGPLPGVGGQANFNLLQTFLVTLEEPVGLGGFVDERGGGAAGRVVTGVFLTRTTGTKRPVRLHPAFDGEFEFGGIFEGQDEAFGAAAG